MIISNEIQKMFGGVNWYMSNVSIKERDADNPLTLNFSQAINGMTSAGIMLTLERPFSVELPTLREIEQESTSLSGELKSNGFSVTGDDNRIFYKCEKDDSAAEGGVIDFITSTLPDDFQNPLNEQLKELLVQTIKGKVTQQH